MLAKCLYNHSDKTDFTYMALLVTVYQDASTLPCIHLSRNHRHAIVVHPRPALLVHARVCIDSVGRRLQQACHRSSESSWPQICRPTNHGSDSTTTKAAAAMMLSRPQRLKPFF